MKPVCSHKPIGNTIFLFGFKPLDFFVVVIGPLLIAIAISYFVGVICFLVFWVVAKKLKKRPSGYFSALFLFLATPEKLSVKPYSDILSYSEAVNADKSDAD